MDSSKIFLVTDIAPGGDNRCALMIGAPTHQDAVDALCTLHPERTPVAVVALTEIEATVARVKAAVRDGSSNDFELIRVG